MTDKISLIGILVNCLLAVGKITVGFITYSASILADGFHSLADIFSSIIGYIGIKVSQKPPDQQHPYGHFKFEVLGGVVIVIFLLAAGVGTIFEAYASYLSPHKIQISYWSFIIMFISVISNYITSKLKIYYGKKENSITLLTDGTHDKMDVLASTAVFVGLFLSRYWGYADSSVAFIIGLYIIWESFKLGKEAINSLLDVSAGEDIENKMKSIVQSENIKLSSLKTQKKGSIISANLEIELDNSLSVEKATQISNELRSKLMGRIEHLQYVIIQIKSHDTETSFYQPTLGQGFGWQRKGRFKTEIPEATGQGPDGECVCPECGYTVPHQKGIPCSSLKCPNCNVSLVRK
jgi:cation diffusion facilitator family transporter